MATPLHPADPDTALALHSMLKAGRELGPERDRDLIALYLEQHAVRSPHRGAAAPAAILRPGVVPAQILGGQLALAAATEYLVQLSEPDAMGYQKVAETLTILCTADLAALATGLALVVGLAACGKQVWRVSAPLRAALGPALATVAGAATVEGLALGVNAEYFWSSDLLLLIHAVAFLFFLLFALCSLTPVFAASRDLH
jgi:hypothetical protein